ncbi:VWA domain-containing protein [Photobacterium frigidiphilum]|uniref:vWA domain-containing protein n=1 Tax=Photobacterium frigidiphilum TaxID=264736 RepID=UPI003D0ABA6C
MANFTFLHPYWFFALIPLGLILPWLKGKAHHSGLIAPHLAKHLGLERGKVKNTPFVILALGWLLSVLALAGPSWEKNTLPAYSLSGARVLVMDMSRSMYATDIAPNRLTQARFKALDMLPGWKEGSTGLVAYAADGYVVSPLTEDSSTLKNLIPNLSPEIMPIQGSNATAGVQEAITLLKQAGHQAGDIIIITDGMTQQESDQTMALVKDQDYRLSILAVGTQQGAPIKQPDGTLLSNSNGNPVIARVEVDTLLPLVKSTGGNLQLSQANNRDVDTIVALTAKPREQANLDKTKELEERVNNGFWLLLPLVLFALLGFRRGVVIAAMFVLMPIDNANASPWVNSNLRGYQLYEQGNFAEAARNFNSPAWKGIAEYKSGDYEKAIETLKPLTDQRSRYNLANAYAQTGKLEESEAIYESILKDDPNDADAKKNLDIVKKAQEQQQQQQQQQKSEQDKSDKNKPEKENQQSDSKQDKSDDSKNQQSPSDQSESQQSKDQKQESSDQQKNGQQNKDQQNADQEKQQKGKDQQSSADGEKNAPQQNQQQDSQQQNEKQSDQDASANNSSSQSQQANEADSNEPSDEDKISQQQGSSKDDTTNDADKKIKAVPAESSDIKNSPENSNANPLSASNPVLKKLEQVPDNTSGLIRAQLLLQARQKQAPKATENSW